MTSVTPMQAPKRIKAKFMGPFAVALAFVLLIFSIAIYLAEVRIRDRDLSERAAAVANLFRQSLDRDANLMLLATRVIMADHTIEHAFRTADRAGLARQGSALFGELRAAHGITHGYFTDTDLVNFYRFHSPAEHGDEIARITTLRARATRAPAHGLELGPFGTLTLRQVVPWLRGDKLLGFVELGEEIEHLIDQVRESLSVDLLVIADKAHLARQQWQRGQALMNRSGDWDRFDTHATIAQTSDRLPAGFESRRLAQLLGGRPVEISDGERALHLALLPLDDAGGRRIGSIVVIRDITELASTFRWSTVSVILGGLVEDTVLLFRQTGNRHLPVETRLPDPPAILNVDPVLIRHALFNLLQNAAQATEGDGAVVITLSRLGAEAGESPGWSLEVADHGRGIAQQDLERIFEPFYTTRSDGTGLGLPVVQQVALLHGGQVTANSDPVRGTRIALILPDIPERVTG